ncbi:MAG: hypothetical protein KTR15_00235 [Phycisphaeraceae bacterium]|nr:hypothetical protein [Phycisphaeraceae bacterium]
MKICRQPLPVFLILIAIGGCQDNVVDTSVVKKPLVVTEVEFRENERLLRNKLYDLMHEINQGDSKLTYREIASALSDARLSIRWPEDYRLIGIDDYIHRVRGTWDIDGLFISIDFDQNLIATSAYYGDSYGGYSPGSHLIR